MNHFWVYLFLISVFSSASLIEADGAKLLSNSKKKFMTHIDSNGNVRTMSSNNLLGESFMSNGGSTKSEGTGMNIDEDSLFMLHTDDDDDDDYDEHEQKINVNGLGLSEYINAILYSTLYKNTVDLSALPEKVYYGHDLPEDMLRVTFTDGSYIDVPKPSRKKVRENRLKHSTYRFPRFRHHARTQSISRRSHDEQNQSPPDRTMVVYGGNGADPLDQNDPGFYVIGDQTDNSLNPE